MTLSPAQTVANKLSLPKRFLIGLGAGMNSAIKSQGLQPDIIDQYLVGVGPGAWPTYNSPAGAYVGFAAANAQAVGAIPMFTLYQMAQNGDGNLSGLTDATFMTNYWAGVKLMFQQIAIYNKPVVVNFEPDFWGYAEQLAKNGDPTTVAADVTVASDCTALSNDVKGIAGCLVLMARKYAPKAVVGFPPSDWGGSSVSAVAAFMMKVGAGAGDLVIMQTLDRDAGCFEADTEADCKRGGSSYYWDEANVTHPNFHDHFANAKIYNQMIGQPLLWWQTPMGVPSTGLGSSQHWRDNRVHYFLTHADELIAAGGIGAVFSAGTSTQTSISTDGGQFMTLSKAYLANPVPLK